MYNTLYILTVLKSVIVAAPWERLPCAGKQVAAPPIQHVYAYND